MPTKGDNILNNIDFSYSKPFYDSIGFYANIWDLFSVESQHNTLKISEFELKRLGLGKRRAKLHMHRIITSVHPLIRHKNKVIANTRLLSLCSSLLADIFLNPAYDFFPRALR